MCGCCSRIVGRPPARAEYRWWSHEGRYFTDLCGSCVGWWLLGAVEDDEMMPVRVEPLAGLSARSDGGA